jgi:hypothetical protein
MADRIQVKSEFEILRLYRNELLRELRAAARPVHRNVRAAAPRRTGNLRKRIRLKVGVDSRGPYARIVTTARRLTTSEEGNTTLYRYGLAIQQYEDYLHRGLAKTPRR